VNIKIVVCQVIGPADPRPCGSVIPEFGYFQKYESSLSVAYTGFHFLEIVKFTRSYHLIIDRKKSQARIN